MACNQSRVHTSADSAEHAGTNTVVVQRVLGRLREAGLLASEEGIQAVGALPGSRIKLRKATSVMEDIECSLIERRGITTITEVSEA